MKFIRDNWLWIAAPLLIFALIVAAILIFGPETQTPNAYQLH